MTTWLPRGLAFAAGMVLLRLVQGTLINTYPTKAGTVSLLLMVVFCLFASAWGFVDGTADARANPDPDRRRDLAMRWLVAGLVAGFLSGLVVWLISLFYRAVYAEGVVPEVTAFAAFTALAIFLPAMVAVTFGRWLVDRGRGNEPRRRGADGTETDVFEEVLDDEDPAKRYASAGRREMDWRQESRESVREVHETVQKAKFDLNRTSTDEE